MIRMCLHPLPSCMLQGYEQGNLAEALRGADLVIMPAGVPRKPGMTRDDLFNVSDMREGILLSSSLHQGCIHLGVVVITFHQQVQTVWGFGQLSCKCCLEADHSKFW